jgi:SAM-dependent methyltransferase
MPELTDDQLLAALSQPARRTTEYRQLVPEYYLRVTDSFRATWGDSFHFGLFEPGDTQQDAVHATERWLARAAALRPGERALDVGCGLGGPALTVARATGAHVTGVDITPRHVEIAAQRAADAGLDTLVEFLVADGMALPFADASFDAVYLSEAGCHMPDWERFAAGCARVLRPGRRFVGIDWGCSEDPSCQGADGAVEKICRAHAIPRLRSLPEVRAGLEAAGLRVDLLEDASRNGQILRNRTTLRVIAPHGLPDSASLTAWRLLALGGEGIREAAARGDFILSRWLATKP